MGNGFMMSIDEIIEATGGRLLYGLPNGVSGVSIDSRTVEEGQLFVALKGERFDGHSFIFDVLKKACGAVVSIPPFEPPKGKVIIHVRNTLKALQDMALYLRNKKAVPVVGITGTNGKTTTKEMTASILGTKFKTLKNDGNLNNQIGLPLSILKFGSADEAAVLEMGASLPGDIKELCRVARPDYGVVTNIGRAHLEGFSDIETVRKTKLEMLDFVKAVAVNADDSFLLEGVINSGFEGRVVKCGIRGVNSPLDIYATDVKLGDRDSAFVLNAGGENVPVTLKVPGLFNIYNALAASSVGFLFDIAIDDIRRGLEVFQGVPMRVEIKEFGGATVISDVYNANPASMEEAVLELIRLRGKRAVAVLGDMLELGSYAEPAHRKLGSWMSSIGVDLLIGVGPLMAMAAEEFAGECIKAADSVEAREALLENFRKGDTILIKGSRGMKMERVLNGEVKRDGMSDRGDKIAL